MSIPTMRKRKRRGRSALPGLPLTLGLSLGWLTLIVLVPLATLLLKAAGMGWQGFIAAGFSARALAAYRLSFGAAAIAALANAMVGLLVAWVLVRYRFLGLRVIDAAIDLPFALPTAVAGITLATLYAPHGWVGGWLARAGIKVAFTELGVTLALVFVGLPFVVRQVQPALIELGREIEEAAATLGATRAQSFIRVILPSLRPALVTGVALAFARGVGEYGSVIFIAGNMPGRTEIAPLLIVTELEQYNYPAATAIATVMMLAALALLLAINTLLYLGQRRIAPRRRTVTA